MVGDIKGQESFHGNSWEITTPDHFSFASPFLISPYSIVAAARWRNRT